MKKLLIVIILILNFPVYGFSIDYKRDDTNRLIELLKKYTDGSLNIQYNELTKTVRFIETDFGKPLISKKIYNYNEKINDISYEDLSRYFIDSYKKLFGLLDAEKELKIKKITLNENQDIFIRYQQLFNYVPVFLGEAIIQLNKEKDIISVTSKLIPNIDISTLPFISPAYAKEIALNAVAKWHNISPEKLIAEEPTLWIYNPIVFNILNNKNYLVWKTEISSIDIKPIQHTVLIDGIDGKIRLHFNTVKSSLKRKIYDNYNDPDLGLPGYGPVRVEGQGLTGVRDVDLAYEYIGDFYYFFKNNFNRDSIDNKGMTLVATVRYCDPKYECPYNNDFWSSKYKQIVLGEGTVTDDCVGHELGHAITDYTADLCYFMQSGAINESFSDIWGEFIDLTNGKGTDSTYYRWYLFEDDKYGASRNMANPGMFQQPQKMTDYYYYCGVSDNGGVHTNSGVGNKTAYLITDGGYFNGYSIAGLGITKTAQIYYEVLNHLLVSGSDYLDLYHGLYQACLNLIGRYGITLYDCEQVRYATLATELNKTSTYCVYPKAPICDIGEPVDIFFDNVEGKAYWKLMPVSINVLPEYLYSSIYARSGKYSLYGENLDELSDFAIAMKKGVFIPRGKPVFLHFEHSYDFESEGSVMYDGGIIEYSIDNGKTWYDAGHMIINNGYDGVIYTGAGNPLSGRYAYTGTSFGFTSSRLNISSISGNNVQFRFRIGNDEAYADDGWYIDNIRIYTCQIKGIDLTGQWSNLYQSCRSNRCTLKGKFSVSNTGTSYSSQFKVRFYLSNNSSYDISDSLLKEVSISKLKYNSSKAISLNIRLPVGTNAFTKYILAIIDQDNLVNETDENNNIIVYGPIY